jgi:hypothetical protein
MVYFFDLTCAIPGLWSLRGEVEVSKSASFAVGIKKTMRCVMFKQKGVYAQHCVHKLRRDVDDDDRALR